MPASIPKIPVMCIKCKYSYEVDEQFVGKMLECPKCRNAFYAKPKSNAIHDTIVHATATTNARIMKDTESTRVRVKRRLIGSRIKRFAVYPILVLIGIIALWQGIKFFSRMTDNPDEKLAFSKAIEYIKAESNILDLDKMEFDKKFKFTVINYKERIFRISTKMTPTAKKKEKSQPRLFHVDMKYLGHGEWEATSWEYDK